ITYPSEDLHQLLQTQLFGIEGNTKRLLREINLRGIDGWQQSGEIFQHPNTGTAVDMRNVQRYDLHSFVVEVQQFFHNLLVGQEIVLAILLLWCRPGSSLQLVI